MSDETIEAKGACMCGAVKFTAHKMSKKAGACHCKMCRQWAGGPYMAIDCGSDITFEGEDNIGVFKSSEWAERGFCKVCGSNLFWRMPSTGQHMMAIGLLENEDMLEFDHQVFIDHKPAYYEFKNNTHDMTEAEILAMYGPDS